MEQTAPQMKATTSRVEHALGVRPEDIRAALAAEVAAARAALAAGAIEIESSSASSDK
jgi:hypothetical protein